MVTVPNMKNIHQFMCVISQKYKTVVTKYKYPTLAQNKSIFYVHKAAMMVDHFTQNEQNSSQIYHYMYKHTHCMI